MKSLAVLTTRPTFKSKAIAYPLFFVLYLSLSTAILFGQCDNCQNNVVLDFDGVDDQVGLRGFTTTPNFTIGAWFNHNADDDTEEDRIIGFSTPRLELGLEDGTGELWCYDGNAVRTWGTNLHDNSWHHVALTKNGSAMSIYLDGVFLQTWTGCANCIYGAPSGGAMIGNWWTSHSTSRWWGQLDDVVIMDSALNSTQVGDLMDCKYAAFTSNIRIHYDWQNGIANGINRLNDSAIDVSGNSINGILRSFALAGNSSNYVSLPNQRTDNIFLDKIELYPNPTSDYVSVDMDKVCDKLSMDVVSVNGKMLSQQVILHQEKFDISLPETAGIYLVIIREAENGQQAVFKIVKR